MEMMKIGDIADVYSGYAFKSKDLSDDNSGIPVIKIGNLAGSEVDYSQTQFFPKDMITDKIEKFSLDDKDVLIAMTGQGSVGRVSQLRKKNADDKLLLNQRVGKFVIDSERGDRDFLFFILSSQAYQEILFAAGSGSGQPNLSPTIIKNIPIPKVNIDIQRKIGRFLSLINDKIETNNQINRNLSEQVAALYKAWFIDFERNDGVCPEEWKAATLGDIAEIGSGKRPPMKQIDKTDDVCIPLVGAASIMGYTNSVLYDSKILVTGRVGTHGVVQRFNNECWPSDNTLVITTDKYEFVNQILLEIDYKSMNRGSTQPLITQGDLKKTEIILPTDAILDEFEALAGGLMSQYEKNILENTKLSELRDTLLPKLMSGELDVSDMDF